MLIIGAAISAWFARGPSSPGPSVFPQIREPYRS